MCMSQPLWVSCVLLRAFLKDFLPYFEVSEAAHDVSLRVCISASWTECPVYALHINGCLRGSVKEVVE